MLQRKHYSPNQRSVALFFVDLKCHYSIFPRTSYSREVCECLNTKKHFLPPLGTLKRESSRYFSNPRNIVSVPGLMKSADQQAVLILDDVGLHAFQQDGLFIK